METKYTKDKWIFLKGDELKTSRVIIGDAHDIELEINGENRLEEEVANALLISKAPEMLEMLNFFINEFDDVFHEETEVYKKVEQTKQLIKEATEL